MKTRTIKTDIWLSEGFCDLSVEARLLCLYLITNPEVSLLKKYKLPLRKIGYDLGFTVEKLRKLFSEVSEIGFYYSGDWVVIENDYGSFDYAGNWVAGAKEEQLAAIPDEINNFSVQPSVQGSVQVSVHSSNSNSNSNSNSSLEEKKFSKFSDIDEVLLEQIAEDYEVPLGFVHKTHESMRLYLGANGAWNKYKDFNLALRGWVRRDADKLKLEMAKSKSYSRGGVADARGL